MAVQFSVLVRDARLNAIETTVGAAPILRLRTGAQPANCAAADSGTVVISYTLPSDWAAAASNGSKAFNGNPVSTGAASAQGTLGHYRLYAADGTTCHKQGSITATGGGGDLTVDNVSVNNGQTVQITTWSLTDGNA